MLGKDTAASTVGPLRNAIATFNSEVAATVAASQDSKRRMKSQLQVVRDEKWSVGSLL